MASKVLGFRVPVDLAEELERTSRENGMTTTDFLRKLVDDALYPSGNRDESSWLGGEATELSTKLEQLTNKVDQLEKKRPIDPDRMTTLNDVPSLSGRVDLLEKTVKILIGDIKENSDKVRDIMIRVIEQRNKMDKGVDQLRSEVVGLHSQLASTTSRISTLEAAKTNVTQVSNRLSKVEREAKRTPTDDIKKIELKDGREHRFKVYRGKAGLVRPYKVATDLLLGGEYIDLSEPLD